MRLWRLALPRFASALDGEGARLFGGRWNSRGIPAVYSSKGPSTALLELLVHGDPEEWPDEYSLIELIAPDSLGTEVIAYAEFPANWRNVPHHPWFREIGDRWLLGQSTALLEVPSVVVPAEANVLINPRHPDAAEITVGSIQPFPLDERFKR